MKQFPQPLSAKDEAEQLSAMRCGSKQARRLLIEHNLRLVAHIVKKYSASDRDTDDLISVGTIGLIKAIDTYNMEKGIRLATYASRCIDNELLMYFRSSKKQTREVYLYEPIGADKEGNEIALLDILEAEDVDTIERMETTARLHKLCKCLPNVLTEREQYIIGLRYGLLGQEEMTQREIAKKLNISRSYVSRIEKKSLQKLASAVIE